MAFESTVDLILRLMSMHLNLDVNAVSKMAFECTVDVILRSANIKASYLNEMPGSIILLKIATLLKHCKSFQNFVSVCLKKESVPKG